MVAISCTITTNGQQFIDIPTSAMPMEEQPLTVTQSAVIPQQSAIETKQIQSNTGTQNIATPTIGQQSLPPIKSSAPSTSTSILPQNSMPTQNQIQPSIAPLPTTPTQPIVPIVPQPAQGLSAILSSNEPFAQKTQMPTPTGQPQLIDVTAKKITPQSDDVAHNIYLNFDNTELGNFINYIAEIKKLNLIPDKGIEGNKISLTIREPLSIDGAWNVFLTVIEMAGFSIIQVGDVHKIISKDKKALQPLPAYINIPVDKVPDNDSNIRFVLFLTNLQTPDVKDLIQSMLSDKGTIVEVKDVNGLILTDKCFNIKSAVRVLQELDQMGIAETVTVMHLKNANAIDVKTLLETIIKQPEVSPLARLLGKTAEGGNQFFPTGTRIIAEERTNSLILLGNPKPIKKIEEFIVNHIDKELQDAKSPLHVFELQYTDATQIAEILNEVTQAGDSTAGQAAAKYGAIRGGVKYFKKMNFKVDKDGNRLIVSSSDKVDWKLLKQTIKDLDKPQPQVAIETLLVTVTVDDTKQIGGNLRLKKPNMLGNNIGFQSASADTKGPSLEYPKDPNSGLPDTSKGPISLLGDLTGQIAATQGLSVLSFGKSKDLWGIFSMLKAQTNSTILSQPFITASNKAKATVTVGTTQRVVQEDSGSTGLKGYADAKAATILEITPQINIDGVIRMHIHTEINEFENASATSTSERKLDTDVTVADGQVLVLGGFVKTSITENKYKTPLLGDLPLFGWLFKSQKRVVNKQYLFIFMCPTIVKPRQIPGMGLYTKMKLHNVTDTIEETIQTKKLPDPLHNWFFNAEKENYSHKVIDFANARYQPTTVDIKNDPYYRTQTYRQEEAAMKISAEPLTIKEPPPIKLTQNIQIPNPSPVQDKIAQIPEPIEMPLENKELVTKKTSTLLPTIEENRMNFKKLISTQEPAPQKTPSAPATKPPLENEFSVDVNKRNNLKEFLSHNPAIANNIVRLDRKGMA